jgi:hypothetical protein
MSSDMYESYAVSFSCAQAASWIKQLVATQLPDRVSGDENPLAGVPGFSCIAYPDRNGHAYSGSCRRGNSEFGWNWNDAYRSMEHLARGMVQTESAEYSSVLRSTGGDKYVLTVGNTSRIGFINGFRWTAPTGMRITAVTRTVGAKCALAPDRSISCSGKLRPPKCLCTGPGGITTINFTASIPKTTDANGIPVTHALVGAHLRLTALTPVPYLIPSTPQEERNQRGV